MKKLFYLMVIALAAVACEGPMGPQGPAGEDGADGTSTSWEIIDLNVPSDNWELQYGAEDGSNPYYTASFDIPEIDDFVYDSGLTMCYIEFNKGTEYRTQQILPYVRHYEGYDESNAQFIWTQTVDYEYAEGRVTIFVTYSDFYVDQKPEAMDFRLVLMW